MGEVRRNLSRLEQFFAAANRKKVRGMNVRGIIPIPLPNIPLTQAAWMEA
jgi:hypothetical protein